MTQRKDNKRREYDDPGIYGKVPPQAKDLEESILGAIMIEKFALDRVIDIISPEVFYVEAHQRIFSSMLALIKKSWPIDINTVCEQLRSTEELEMCGGVYYVTKLTNSVVSSANIETHSKIIFQKFIARQYIQLGGEMIGQAYEDATDVFDMIDDIEKRLYQVTSVLHKKPSVSLDTLIVKAVSEIHALMKNDQEISGVPSGFKSVDMLTHGWQPTDLIILAARPGVGKTALALNFARNAALHPVKPTAVGFFSLEMSAGQLVRRILASESEMSLKKIQRGRMDEEEFKTILYPKGVQRLSQAPIHIDDTPGLNIFDLRHKARAMKRKYDIGLLIVDYLQLMSGTNSNGRNSNREQEISEISRGLKMLAKELGIPVMALSQLSRETEKRADKSPVLSDLRESGAIEQDADAVVFIYRPEYYGIHRDASGESNPGETILKFAKYRNGEPGSCKLRAQLWIQKFIEWEDDPNAKPKKKEEKVGKDGRNKEGVTVQWMPFKEQVDKNDETFS
jgi:replicative DNA helicase